MRNAGVRSKNNVYLFVNEVEILFENSLILGLIDNVVYVVFALYSRKFILLLILKFLQISTAMWLFLISTTHHFMIGWNYCEIQFQLFWLVDYYLMWVLHNWWKTVLNRQFSEINWSYRNKTNELKVTLVVQSPLWQYFVVMNENSWTGICGKCNIFIRLREM
jgi:hypothetical protein